MAIKCRSLARNESLRSHSEVWRIIGHSETIVRCHFVVKSAFRKLPHYQPFPTMDFRRLQCYLYGDSGMEKCRTIPRHNLGFHWGQPIFFH